LRFDPVTGFGEIEIKGEPRPREFWSVGIRQSKPEKYGNTEIPHELKAEEVLEVSLDGLGIAMEPLYRDKAASAVVSDTGTETNLDFSQPVYSELLVGIDKVWGSLERKEKFRETGTEQFGFTEEKLDACYFKSPPGVKGNTASDKAFDIWLEGKARDRINEDPDFYWSKLKEIVKKPVSSSRKSNGGKWRVRGGNNLRGEVLVEDQVVLLSDLNGHSDKDPNDRHYNSD
jgi:hypothetical protein